MTVIIILEEKKVHEVNKVSVFSKLALNVHQTVAGRTIRRAGLQTTSWTGCRSWFEDLYRAAAS